MVDSFVQKTDDPSSPVGFAAARRKQMTEVFAVGLDLDLRLLLV